MGMRSNIAVKLDGKILVALYYQWNYGERMMSRVAHFIGWLNEYRSCGGRAKGCEPPCFLSYYEPNFGERVRHILETNFDYEDVVFSTDLIREAEEFNESIAERFWGSHNNNGYALISCERDGTIRYAFTHDGETALDAKGYMLGDSNEEYLTPMTGANPSVIDEKLEYNKMLLTNEATLNKYATLMTDDEVATFFDGCEISEYAIKPDTEVSCKLPDGRWVCVKLNAENATVDIVVGNEKWDAVYERDGAVKTTVSIDSNPTSTTPN